MMETRLFVLIGTVIVGTGFLAVVIDCADPLQIAAAVAAVISLLATAVRPTSEEPQKWTGYLSAVTILGALIVLTFLVAPHFLAIEPPNPRAGSKRCPPGTRTPAQKPKMERKK